MRCVNAIKDDLHDYAAAVLGAMEGVLSGSPVEVADFESFNCEVLNRVGRMQVELVTIKPNVWVPLHSHPGVDSIDLLVAGTVALTVGDLTIRRPLKRLGVRIPQDCMHGGKVGSDGVTFLSCQRWNRQPDFIARSWIGWPVNRTHASIVHHLKAVA